MADNLKKIHSITQLNNSIFKEVKFNIPVIEGFKLDTSLVERIEELQSINKILFTDNSIKKSLSFINTFTEEFKFNIPVIEGFKLDTSLIQEYLDFINNAVINEKNQDNSRDDSEQTKSEIISFLKNNFPGLK